MADMKRTIIIIGIALIIFGGAGYCVGYSLGNSAGNSTGWEKGTTYGNNIGYERGYSLGYDNGKEYVVTHIDEYAAIPKPVKYDEVVKFLEEDRTSDIQYSEDFDCVSFTKAVKEQANIKGIKCAVVSMRLYDYELREKWGHAVNCFETTDRGIVYFDPQTDGQRYGIEVGGTYILSGITYKIAKVDVIW